MRTIYSFLHTRVVTGALVSGEDPAGGGGLQARLLHGGALPRPGRVLSGKLGGRINIFYSHLLAGPC